MMRYKLIDGSSDGQTLYEGDDPCEIATIVATRKDSRFLCLFFTLPVAFTVNFELGHGIKEVVILGNGTTRKEVDDPRKRLSRLEVLCFAGGQLGVVENIALHFRDYNDRHTDRGMIWVYPGYPAKGKLDFNSRNGISYDLVLEIIKAAEQKVHEKVLVYFPELAASTSMQHT